MRKLTKRDFLEIGSGLVLFAFLINNFPIPIKAIAKLEYSSDIDITGRGRCRIENSIPVERGWIFVGDTKAGIHIRGLTEDLKVVENTCKWDCSFENVERVYYVDRENVYVVYPVFKKVECQDFVFKSKDDITINDEYQACLRKLHFQGSEIAEILPKMKVNFPQ